MYVYIQKERERERERQTERERKRERKRERESERKRERERGRKRERKRAREENREREREQERKTERERERERERKHESKILSQSPWLAFCSRHPGVCRRPSALQTQQLPKALFTLLPQTGPDDGIESQKNSQTAQHGLTKEYTLNAIVIPNMDMI